MMLRNLDRCIQRNEFGPLFHIMYSKKSLRWIKCLNIRFETIKFLEKNIGVMLFDINLVIIFFNQSPQARKTKTKINTWNYIKQKSSCIVKETIK